MYWQKAVLLAVLDPTSEFRNFWMLLSKSQLYDINEYVILFQKKAQEAHALLEKLGPKVELVSHVHILLLTV